jgi:anthranilate synthase/aminodeoxychorismate synthase-like glutamine amidotransferase
MKDKIRLVLIDNYDSFTYNLYDYLTNLGADCQVFRNDKISIKELEQCHFDALVLSPGPKRPKDAGLLMEIIAYYHKRKPILGICLGMQAIGEYFGAKLVHALVPIHGKTSEVYHNASLLFDNIANPTIVMRYHSLVLKDLPECIESTGFTNQKELMALKHKFLPIFGLQFHPESILTKDGYQMLDNWIQFVKHYEIADYNI